MASGPSQTSGLAPLDSREPIAAGASQTRPAPMKQVHTDQGLFAVWHGMTIGTLFRTLCLRPGLSLARLPMLLSLPFSAASNSFWSTLERWVYGRKIRAAQVHPPIFLIGHWRSGTTLLHNLMSLDRQFTFFNLFHAVFPAHFLITERWLGPLTKFLLPATRPMDNMPTGWELPQEDEIGMMNLTAVSPYLCLALQGRPHLYERFWSLQTASSSEQRRWREGFDLLMRKLTVREDKPVILKSPGYAFRVRRFLELYPDARFVYIYRNPYAVLKSTYHMRRTMVQENHFGGAKFSELEQEIDDIYENLIRTYESEKSAIPPGRLVEMSYETLAADPLGAIRRVYEELQLPGFAEVAQQLEPLVPTLKRYEKNKFSMSVEQRRKIYARMKFAFDLYGYAEDPEDAAVNVGGTPAITEATAEHR